MKNNIITIILLSLFSFSAFAKTEYKVEINFTGNTDSSVILAHYFGNTFQIIDTIELKNQTALIAGTEPLKQGVYTIARFDKSKYFDFIIGDNPFFKISANTKNLLDSINVIGSLDNKFFFKYIQLNSKLFHVSKQIQQANQKNNSDLLLEKDLIFSNLQLLKDDVGEKLPESVLDIIFTSMEKPEIPPEIASNDRKRYQYFKSHYWDLIALDDVRMLRTPVFHNKFEYFFDRIVMQHPDTLIHEIDKLFKKEIDPEIFKYMIWNLTLKYEQPKIMGLDKAFVHLADNYYKTNKIKNMSQGIIDNIIERAEKTRPMLIGKTAPNMIMVDSSGKFDALNNYLLKDYTIILFWDSDCQTCQKEIKELQKLYHSDKYNFEVFAVGTDMNIEIWKKYIRDNNIDWINVNGTRSVTQDYHDLYGVYSTPTMYILNNQKQIIAKDLSVNQIQGFLQNYEQNLNIK